MTLLISLVFVLVFFSFHSCCDNTGMHKMQIAVSIAYQFLSAKFGRNNYVIFWQSAFRWMCKWFGYSRYRC